MVIMGRQIDLENLTDEDVPFLIQRPWLVAQAQHEGFEVPALYFGVETPDGPSESEGSDTHSAGAPVGTVTGETLDDSELDDEYDTWSKTDLENELVERDLPKGGTKAELIARLRASDLEDEDEDEEEDDPED